MGFQKSLSRRDFLKMSMLAAGGAASAGMLGMPYITMGQDTTELTLVHPGRELGIKYWDVIIAGFNAKMQEDGKPFRMKQTPGPATDNDYVTKITLDAASGTLSDVVSVNSARYEDMAAAGYLADLTGMLEGNADWEQYSQVVKDQLAIDGKIYGVADAGTFTLYYRKDLLSDAGISIEQPKTWEDFYGVADEILTKTGATPIGIPAARAWGGGTWEEGFRHVWLGFAESNEIFDTADGKWVVKSDGLLKALQVYETLATNKWLTVDALLSPNPWEPIKYQGFPGKTVGVVTGGDWQWEFDWGPNGATPIEGLFDNVDRWQFPSAIGDPFVFVGIGGPMSVYSQSKNIDGALEFILYAGSPAGSCTAMETYLGGPSARKDFAANCEFYTTAINGKIAEAGALIETGRSLKAGVGQGKIADGIALATEEVITLAKPAQQAMDDFAANMKEQLGEEAVKEL